jgi:hypothetical protein
MPNSSLAYPMSKPGIPTEPQGSCLTAAHDNKNNSIIRKISFFKTKPFYNVPHDRTGKRTMPTQMQLSMMTAKKLKMASFSRSVVYAVVDRLPQKVFINTAIPLSAKRLSSRVKPNLRATAIAAKLSSCVLI